MIRGMKKRNHGNNKIKWVIYLILGGFLAKFFCFVFKSCDEKKITKNFSGFLRKEKKEIQELSGGKESLKEYCEDASSIFKSYFIPNGGNNFKPRILRTRQLAVISVVLLVVKLSVSGYLFFVYPNLARMSAVIQDEIYTMINDGRNDNGVIALSMNEKLSEIARKKAEDMINKNYFAHENPEGKMIWDMISRDEYPYIYIGENLAMNFTSAQSAHKALMLSPTHRKNILNPRYSEIGIAVVSGEINNKKTNILVEVFAYPRPTNQALVMEAVPSKEDISSVAGGPTKKSVSAAKISVLESVADEAREASSSAESFLGESAVLSVESGKMADLGDAEIISRQFIGDEKRDLAVGGFRGDETRISASAKSVSVGHNNGAEARIINYSQYIFIGALILLILLLLVNIVVRASVQHKPVIIQTLLVILFTFGLMTIKFHFLEYITEKILVL